MMMEREPLETASAHGFPTVRQLSVFIENRVGQLLRLTKLLDATEIRILALSIVNGVDCAVIRMVVDSPDEGTALLRKHEFPVTETELIVVSLPEGKRALLDTWAALMAGEISVHYTYPLLVHPKGCPALAVHADDNEMAVRVLREKRLEVLDEQDLARGTSP